MPRPLLPANDVINLIMKNQTILITGGTTGIGLATAKLLSAEGAKIIITGRNPETLAAVQRELPGVIVIKVHIHSPKLNIGCLGRAGCTDGSGCVSRCSWLRRFVSPHPHW